MRMPEFNIKNYENDVGGGVVNTKITLDKTENPELNNQQVNEKIKRTIKMKRGETPGKEKCLKHP